MFRARRDSAASTASSDSWSVVEDHNKKLNSDDDGFSDSDVTQSDESDAEQQFEFDATDDEGNEVDEESDIEVQEEPIEEEDEDESEQSESESDSDDEMEKDEDQVSVVDEDEVLEDAAARHYVATEKISESFDRLDCMLWENCLERLLSRCVVGISFVGLFAFVVTCVINSTWIGQRSHIEADGSSLQSWTAMSRSGQMAVPFPTSSVERFQLIKHKELVTKPKQKINLELAQPPMAFNWSVMGELRDQRRSNEQSTTKAKQCSTRVPVISKTSPKSDFVLPSPSQLPSLNNISFGKGYESAQFISQPYRWKKEKNPESTVFLSQPYRWKRGEKCGLTTGSTTVRRLPVPPPISKRHQHFTLNKEKKVVRRSAVPVTEQIDSIRRGPTYTSTEQICSRSSGPIPPPSHVRHTPSRHYRQRRAVDVSLTPRPCSVHVKQPCQQRPAKPQIDNDFFAQFIDEYVQPTNPKLAELAKASLIRPFSDVAQCPHQQRMRQQRRQSQMRRIEYRQRLPCVASQEPVCVATSTQKKSVATVTKQKRTDFPLSYKKGFAYSKRTDLIKVEKQKLGFKKVESKKDWFSERSRRRAQIRKY